MPITIIYNAHSRFTAGGQIKFGLIHRLSSLVVKAFCNALNRIAQHNEKNEIKKFHTKLKNLSGRSSLTLLTKLTRSKQT